MGVVVTYIRKSVLGAGAPWTKDVLWYARAVGVMMKRPVADKTSWAYLAAMHGFLPPLWISKGLIKNTDALPAQSERDVYWNQCQHQSWYFLPWHRSYLLSFEAIVRAAVVSIGGPADWALPYWNYSADDPNALKIPKPFLDKKLPGGNDPNPLYIAARYGSQVWAEDASLVGRLDDHDFEGIDPSQGGGQTGVGGPRTPFNHGGGYEGLIEAAPHDLVHVDVGGRGGLMSDPRTAGYDPIFWVHHANIDRLWAVWNKLDARNKNPDDAAWKNGPADRAFAFFGAKKEPIPSKPGQVVNTLALGYDYDDTSSPFPPDRSRRSARLSSLADAAEPADLPEHAPAVARETELLGANSAPLSLGLSEAVADVELAAKPAERLKKSFSRQAMLASTPGEPDRVFLHLDNIKGDNGAAVFEVTVEPATDGGQDKAVPVGRFSLFGLETATDEAGADGGQGLNKVLEVTQAIDALHIDADDLSKALRVRITARNNVEAQDDIVVGQVSFTRQSG